MIITHEPHRDKDFETLAISFELIRKGIDAQRVLESNASKFIVSYSAYS